MYMRIYAHRGVSAHLPENTLAAFSRAIDLGVDGIELDVHLSAEKIPMVIHDETVDRTTNGTGRISEFTAVQLGLLDAGHGQFVPTLDQVLGMAAGKVRVNIELKDDTSVAAVLGVIAEHPGLDWFCSSMQFTALTQMCELAPGSDCQPATFGWEMNADGGGDLQESIDFALLHKSTGVSVWEGLLDHTTIDMIHASGLKVWAWTVNDTDRAHELANMGVDALCTDDPELIRTALCSVPTHARQVE